MAVYISKELLGTDFHIGWDGTDFIKKSYFDEEDWVFDKGNKVVQSLRPLCTLKSINIDFPDTVEKNIWSQISYSTSKKCLVCYRNINWV